MFAMPFPVVSTIEITESLLQSSSCCLYRNSLPLIPCVIERVPTPNAAGGLRIQSRIVAGDHSTDVQAYRSK